MLPLTKGLGTFESKPHFFSFYTHKEIFLRPLGSGGEQRPIVFDPIAPGIYDVDCQLLVIDPFDTHVLSAKCLVSSTTIFGPLKGLSP